MHCFPYFIFRLYSLFISLPLLLSTFEYLFVFTRSSFTRPYQSVEQNRRRGFLSCLNFLVEFSHFLAFPSIYSNHLLALEMFSYIRETDDSTTVNFSTYGKFIPSSGGEIRAMERVPLQYPYAVSGSQLVTIGAKFLRIFRTNPYALVPPADSTEEWWELLAKWQMK